MMIQGSHVNAERDKTEFCILRRHQSFEVDRNFYIDAEKGE